VLYDESVIVENLINLDMSRDDAWDYFFYNIKGAYMGEFTPLYANLLNGETQNEKTTK
jgi:hypothetical protein